MEVDAKNQDKKITFSNSKQKTFNKYTGRKFTTNDKGTGTREVDMNEIVEDLKESLP